MKNRILLSICLFFCISLTAQVAGPDSPNSFSNAFLPGYSQQWINVSNAQFDDEVYATFGNLPGVKGTHTDYLMVKDFGFQIPAGTIINGIKVEVNCADPNSRTSDYSVRIVKTGNITGSEKASGTPYPSSDDYMTYGSSTDLWGDTWDYKFIDDNQFGVVIAAQRNTSDDVTTDGRVDNIRITVYYTLITLPLTLTSFTATVQNKTVQLNWKASSENNIDNYFLERSADGRNFNSITTIRGLNVPDASYNYADNYPLPGLSYYRLNIRGASGYQKYSQVLSVKFSKEHSVTIFPNLWHKGEDLNITNDNNEKLTVYFFTAGGQLLSRVATDTKLVSTESMSIRPGLIYYKIVDDKSNILGTGHLLIL
jgi:hypothetical protein